MAAPEPVFGTDGNDVLATALDKQWVYGLAGNDDLTSTGNNTSLDGGKGDDRLSTILLGGGAGEPEPTSSEALVPTPSRPR